MRSLCGIIVHLENATFKKKGEKSRNAMESVELKPGHQLAVELVSTLKGHMERAGLSKREQEIAHLIYEGLKDREIADKLYISRYTVENHMRSIYAKFGVNNRTRLVRKLIAFG
jgi:DNA-binding CsgD family transcriptional regulator